MSDSFNHQHLLLLKIIINKTKELNLKICNKTPAIHLVVTVASARHKYLTYLALVIVLCKQYSA